MTDVPYPYPLGNLNRRHLAGGVPLGVTHLDAFGRGTRYSADPVVADITGSMLVTGPRRSGASTTMATLAAGVLACDDTMIWVIDPLIGPLSATYLRVAAGYPAGPGADWFAATVDEAQLVASAALAVARERHNRRAQMMVNGGRFPVGPDAPAIVLIVADGGDMINSYGGSGAGAVSKAVTDIVNIGRSVGVHVVYQANDYMNLPDGLDRAVSSRIMMRPGDNNEFNHVFGYHTKAQRQLDAGSGALRLRPGDEPTWFDGYHTTAETLATIAFRTAHRRPSLDDQSAAAAYSFGYADRHERTVAAIGPLPERVDQQEEKRR